MKILGRKGINLSFSGHYVVGIDGVIADAKLVVATVDALQQYIRSMEAGERNEKLEEALREGGWLKDGG